MFEKQKAKLVAILVSVFLLAGCGIEGLSASTYNASNNTEDQNYSDEVNMPDESENDITAEEESDLDVEASAAQEDELMVWIPRTGKMYHSKPTCSNMKNPKQVPISEALKLKKKECSKCW